MVLLQLNQCMSVNHDYDYLDWVLNRFSLFQSNFCEFFLWVELTASQRFSLRNKTSLQPWAWKTDWINVGQQTLLQNTALDWMGCNAVCNVCNPGTFCQIALQQSKDYHLKHFKQHSQIIYITNSYFKKNHCIAQCRICKNKSSFHTQNFGAQDLEEKEVCYDKFEFVTKLCKSPI